MNNYQTLEICKFYFTLVENHNVQPSFYCTELGQYLDEVYPQVYQFLVLNNAKSLKLVYSECSFIAFYDRKGNILVRYQRPKL